MPDDRHAQLIVQALSQAGWPRTTAALAQTTGLRPPLVTKALERLSDQGTVERVARGVYRLPSGSQPGGASDARPHANQARRQT